MFSGGTYLRSLWKQKPAPWGPRSVVRAVVYDRAAALGIKPTDISKYFPLLGDTKDVVSNEDGITNAGYKRGGYDINGTLGNEISYGVQDQVVAVANDEFTIMLDFTYPGYSQYQTLISQGSYNGGWLLYQYTSAAFYFRGPTGQIVLTFVPESKSVLTLVMKDETLTVILNNDIIIEDISYGSITDGYSRPFAFGARHNGSAFERQWTGSIKSALIMDSGDLDVALALNENPYQLIQPPVQRSFSIPSGNPSINYPSNEATNVIQPITFSWSSVTGAVNYQLQIADTEAGLDTLPEIDTTITAPATTKDIDGLDPSTTYYSRVRAET